MIWFSADYHLSHENIMKYCHRPFKTVEEMNDTILNNVKNLVKPKDILYFLGDLSFNAKIARETLIELKTLGLEIHFVLGNHDHNNIVKIAEEYCTSVSILKDIKIQDQLITLCHYAMRVWNKSHFNAWQLYGHSHGEVPPLGKQHDVGVDNNNFKPVSYEELIELMNKRQNNLNYIAPEKRDRNNYSDL